MEAGFNPGTSQQSSCVAQIVAQALHEGGSLQTSIPGRRLKLDQVFFTKMGEESMTVIKHIAGYQSNP